MSKREAFINDVRLMPEDRFDYLFAIWEDCKAREEAEDIEDFRQAVLDCREDKNCSGPYKTADEAIRAMLED